MEIISFYENDRQEHWLRKLDECDWRAGASLCRMIRENTFFDRLGKNSRLLLLTDGDDIVSFCTYAEKDDIQPTDLTPWIGFVYTYPKYRGHRYFGLLMDEIERLAEEENVSAVYISTNETGLYEKYGCEYYAEMTDIHGEPSRVYIRRFAV
jgi:GNAT superfamily N-acetyltransferase